MSKRMNIKKILSALLFLFLLLFLISFIYNIYIRKTSLNFSKLIENENINDISLTIYYLSPDALMLYPVSSVEDLIQCCDRKIVINGSSLEGHIDLFKQISNDDLKMVMRKSSDLDLRIYYLLESRKNGKLFDVAMWGEKGDSIFVNEFEVKENDIFYDVIIPFLSEDEVKGLENFKMHNRK